MTKDEHMELSYLVDHGSEAEICEYVAGLAWEDLEQAYHMIRRAGVTENDVMLWTYLNLK